MHPATGWVACDVADRLRSWAGLYRWDEYDLFAHDVGIVIRERHDMPVWLPAFHVHRIVFLRRGQSIKERARHAWHEIAHILMHPASFHFWESLPWGHLMIGKAERQAWEFVDAFPVWDDEAISICG